PEAASRPHFAARPPLRPPSLKNTGTGCLKAAVLYSGRFGDLEGAMATEPVIPPEVESMWRMVLTEGHRSKYAFLPSSPRCVGCMEPFGGLGGKIMALLGHRRSRKNPHMCNL